VKVLNEIRNAKLAKKGIKSVNSDVVVFIFFLLLSFILWYLNSLEKEIEADVRYPVKYINVPKGKTITEDFPAKLVLYLKGSGYKVLKLKVSHNKLPAVIDFSRVNYKKVPDSKKPDYYIVTSSLTKSLTVQLRLGCEITSVKPDTLFFTLERAKADTSPAARKH